MRTATALAALALAAAGLTGCGGDDDASAEPSDVTVEEFCQGFTAMADVDADASGDDVSAQVRAVKDAVADLEEGGVPEEMPQDARKGFTVFADTISDIDDDASMEDLQSAGQDLDQDDEADADAFISWAQENCLSVPEPEESTSPE